MISKKKKKKKENPINSPIIFLNVLPFYIRKISRKFSERLHILKIINLILISSTILLQSHFILLKLMLFLYSHKVPTIQTQLPFYFFTNFAVYFVSALYTRGPSQNNIYQSHPSALSSVIITQKLAPHKQKRVNSC